MTSTQEKNQGANLIVPRIRPSSAAGGSGRFRPFDHVTGERTILAAALILFFVVGYVVVGLSGSRTGAYTLMTWLDTRINALEEEAGQVRAEIMASVNDPESLEMEACLVSPEQIARICEEMSTKLAWYEEQIPLLKQRLGDLFGEEDIS